MLDYKQCRGELFNLQTLNNAIRLQKAGGITLKIMQYAM